MIFNRATDFRRVLGGPDWRHRAALDGRELDRLTRQAGDYFRMASEVPQGAILAAQRYPKIAAAEAAWKNPANREALQLMVLAGCPAEEIAARLRIAKSVVSLLEALHFDVREQLQSPMCIEPLIIEAGDAGNRELAARMRMAYYGGPLVVQLMLDADSGAPMKAIERTAAASMRLHGKLIEAAAIPLNEAHALKILTVGCKLQFEERRLAIRRDENHARMQRWAERREIEKVRLELRRDRQAAKRQFEVSPPAGGPATAKRRDGEAA